MRVFVAGLMTETNTFSAIPASRSSFENAMFFRPKSLSAQPEPQALSLIGYGAFVRKSLERGYETYTSLHAFAEPAAPTRREDYEVLRDEILDDLRRAGPLDMVLLMLHGAQMAQGYDDCEGDILERVRNIVGQQCFVGVLLDLHGNVSAKMVTAADALVACRLYPHTDFDSRAEHLFELAERYVRGEIRTEHFVYRVPVLALFFTTLPGMIQLNADADAVERSDGVHSVSLMHGFPWADQPDTGAAIVVVAEPGHARAAEAARELGHRLFSLREETRSGRRSIDEILDEVQHSPVAGTFVVADAADNSGGGAGSDSTFILKRLLERGVQDAALGMLWDPIAVGFASDAGCGSTFSLRLGGKTGRFAGDPLDVEVTVLALAEGLAQIDPGGGPPLPLGKAALLRVGGVCVVVNSVRQQVFSPECFTQLGVDLARMRIVVVKSTQHFHDQFAPFASKVFYCDTPGSLTLSFERRFYKRLQGAVWPLDENIGLA
jgi:microcystin degradation protein MlrC